MSPRLAFEQSSVVLVEDSRSMNYQSLCGRSFIINFGLVYAETGFVISVLDVSGGHRFVVQCVGRHCICMSSVGAIPFGWFSMFPAYFIWTPLHVHSGRRRVRISLRVCRQLCVSDTVYVLL